MFLRLGPSRRKGAGRGGGDVPLVAMVPNLLTALALCSGLASVHFALSERWERALAAIVLAGIFDVLDGAAARLLRSTSRFGAVLDSLSDFLAFGIAPAIILHEWVLEETTTRLVDTLGLMAVMMFALCSALRLARFTAHALAPVTLVGASVGPSSGPSAGQGGGGVTAAHGAGGAKAGSRPGLFFTGMPTPAAAGAALVPACLLASDELSRLDLPEPVVAGYLLVIAVLMVSRAPMFALKGVRVPRRMAALVFVLLVVLAALMVTKPWLTLAGLSLLYLASAPVAALVRSRQLRAQASPAHEAPAGGV